MAPIVWLLALAASVQYKILTQPLGLVTLVTVIAVFDSIRYISTPESRSQTKV